MTRDDVLRLAREAGGADITSNGHTSWVGTGTPEFLNRFAAAVMEECAGICDETPVGAHDCDDLVEELIHQDCAAAIRERKPK